MRTGQWQKGTVVKRVSKLLWAVAAVCTTIFVLTEWVAGIHLPNWAVWGLFLVMTASVLIAGILTVKIPDTPIAAPPGDPVGDAFRKLEKERRARADGQGGGGAA